jgi:RNA polymerase sigma-70 factor (ECF subfamily)
MNPSPPRTPYPTSDASLVRRMQGGDERALSEFYDRWYPVVNGVVSRMVKSPSDAEDVVEETFWQVWRQCDRFDTDRGSVQTWLLTIARSRALDRLRSAQRRREEPIDETPAESTAAQNSAYVDQASDPSLAAELSERRKLVRDALADLPAEQREALELGYFGGLTQAEIAERTGQPLGTVKTRMRLAMMKLKDRLSLLREDAR